ncbi:TPA_asm: maturation protein [ssRNA phage SRR5466338_2]|uniref:Maturation protein n=1 Tax=ssRNA phage SRR5466338_2 TaxID=2786391 RepID=A0A8S5L578_9VIRU|nr:maturation protein [ssRNA phage SRR5466338_2]DAD52362.1 TPA_asm: maturation protein [ssRNA phage SRR5466338_2]
MISDGVQRFATRRTVATTVQGTTITETEPLCYTHIGDVANGLVQGDHSKPLPFKFTNYRKFAHPYIRYLEDVAYGEKSYQTTDGQGLITPSTYPGGVELDFARTRDRALSKCMDQVRGDSSNIVVDIAESAQVVKMFQGTANLKRVWCDFLKNTIGSMGRQWRKRDPNSTYQHLDTHDGQRQLDYLTGRWLEYRYGWMPLVHSIYDGLDTLAKDVTRGRFTVFGRSGYASRGTKIVGGGTYLNPRETVHRQIDCRTHLGLTFWCPPGPDLYDWTSLSPLSIAWELTPLSFVADWVLNVSQQLSALEDYWYYRQRFDSGYRTDGYRDTTTVTRSGSETTWKISNHGFITCQRYLSDGTTHLTTFKERVVLDELPMPSMKLRIKLKLGAERQLDAAALFHQLVGRKIRGIRGVMSAI